MSNVGIPTWDFQLQPRNSEAREPTNELLNSRPEHNNGGRLSFSSDSIRSTSFNHEPKQAFKSTASTYHFYCTKISIYSSYKLSSNADFSTCTLAFSLILVVKIN